MWSSPSRNSKGSLFKEDAAFKGHKGSLWYPFAAQWVLLQKESFQKVPSDTERDSFSIGRTPKGAYSTRGRSRHLLETPSQNPF